MRYAALIRTRVKSLLRVSEMPIDRWRSRSGKLTPEEQRELLYRSAALRFLILAKRSMYAPLSLYRSLHHLFKLLSELDRLHFAPMRRLTRGVGCVVDHQTWLVNAHNIVLGDYVKVSAYSSVMAGYESTIRIGANTIIGPSVLIASFNHGQALSDVPIRYQPWQDTPEGSIEIGENVWIGAHAIVLPGTKIGDGAVIGAGTVVRGKVSRNAIYVSETRAKSRSRE